MSGTAVPPGAPDGSGRPWSADVVDRLSAELGRRFGAAGLGPVPTLATLVEDDGERTRHRILVEDEPVPLTVDVLIPTGQRPSRTVFLLPGGGLNTAADFLTPRGRGLADFLCAHGFLAIGISPREDGLTSNSTSTGTSTGTGTDVRDWGLVRHRGDALRVVAAAQTVLPQPYDLLGHSAGAVLALDLAATTPTGPAPGPAPGPGPDRVIVLDTTGPYDPRAEPALAARAEDLLTACQKLLEQGVQVVDPGLKALFARAATDPEGASPVPRPVAGPATSFSNAGLLHYALIRTSDLPGPANWIYHQGFSGGRYLFADSPAEDRFELDHTPIGVWSAAVARLGSGLQPTALLRDLAAVWAGREEVHRIDWSAIRAEVIWVNTGLGRGDHDHGPRLIRERAGTPVRFTVLPGYGHGDVVWSATAEQDLWRSLLPGA